MQSSLPDGRANAGLGLATNSSPTENGGRVAFAITLAINLLKEIPLVAVMSNTGPGRQAGSQATRDGACCCCCQDCRQQEQQQQQQGLVK